jgi:hypothetical protein
VKLLLISLLAAVPGILWAQNPATCVNPFQSPAAPGTDLSMTLRSGDITIEGTDASVVRVTCSVDSLRVSFAANHLTVRGGDHDGISYRIEVPRSMNLRIKCTAGNVSISGVTGNKDVDLNAGNLTITVGDPASYRDVEASVLAGNLTAPAFGAEHDGLFRKFRHENPKGNYRLHATLLAGNLTLR